MAPVFKVKGISSHSLCALENLEMAPEEIRKDDNQNKTPPNLRRPMVNLKPVAPRQIPRTSQIPKLIARKNRTVYYCPFSINGECDFAVTSDGLLSGMGDIHLSQDHQVKGIKPRLYTEIRVHQVKASDLKVRLEQPPSSSDSTEQSRKYRFIKKQVNAPAFFKITFDEMKWNRENVGKVQTRKRIDDVSLSLDKMTL